eukprot:COSAG04_NODE_7014_length_1209_cov_1.650450_2_plen_232_part_00
MEPKGSLLLALQYLLTKTYARDRMARIVLYVCKFQRGVLRRRQRKKQQAAEEGCDLLLRTEAVHDTIQEARRIYRFFKVIQVLMSLGRVNERNLLLWALHWGNKLCYACYFTLDSAFVVVKVGGLTGPEGLRRLKNSMFRMLAVGNLIGTAFYSVKLWIPGGHLTPARVAMLVVRSLLLTVQAIHNGELVETNDILIGPLGVITAMFDLIGLWPTDDQMVSVGQNFLPHPL